MNFCLRFTVSTNFWVPLPDAMEDPCHPVIRKTGKPGRPVTWSIPKQQTSNCNASLGQGRQTKIEMPCALPDRMEKTDEI